MVNNLPANAGDVRLEFDPLSTLHTRFCIIQVTAKLNKWESESEALLVMSDSLRLLGLYSPWTSLGQNTGVGSLSLLQGNLPDQEIKPWPSALLVYSLPTEPQGKPKNTGVGSLSVLQRIFPTQESNQGLLHCRWILYQLSYEGSLNGKCR